MPMSKIVVITGPKSAITVTVKSKSTNWPASMCDVFYMRRRMSVRSSPPKMKLPHF